MSNAQEVILDVAEVLLDDALHKLLDYRIPEHLLRKIVIGSRVQVPVKTSVRQGTVISLKDKSAFELQPIAKLAIESPVPKELWQLATWMSAYYCTSFRHVVKTLLPPALRGKSRPRLQLFIKPQVSLNQIAELCTQLRKKHPKQAEVLDVILRFGKGILLSELLEQVPLAQSSINTLIKKKILLSQNIQIDRSILDDAEYIPTKPKVLNEEQSAALQNIKKSLDDHRFEVRLLHGVTGSGKTEVYFQAIHHALNQQKGVIFLVPEIALTSQTIERLKSRFKEKMAILHHRLSHGERFDAWHQIQKGETKIVVGARSAIFSPVQNLGLIIVDEEHESSYKQTDDAPTYHARDVAVMRAKLSSATVILGSATPSCESYYNAKIGKYQLSTLKTRPDHAFLPDVLIVDMKDEALKNQGFTLFSDALLQALKQRLEKGEQAIFFLNRRGYHTSQMCSSCAYVLGCPHCDLHLTYHLGNNVLACHLCDYRLSPPPRKCPHCHAEDSLKFKGAGTEMVEKALHALLPEMRTLRLDADTTKHKGSHDKLFKSFRAGKADVLIGTQMIAKGLHFPQVTLVGVLNAASGLNVPDFRASETTFQLLTQVAGRSGRGPMRGDVIIQTHLPDHPIIELAKQQNYEAFFEQEIAVRQLFDYPPFTHLIKVTFKGKDPRIVQEKAAQLREEWIRQLPEDFAILPLVACGRAKIKDAFRFQCIIKAKKLGPLRALLQGQAESWKLEKNLQLQIDVDPLSTFF